MTTYEHPKDVQLINCDCTSCTRASSMFIQTWGKSIGDHGIDWGFDPAQSVPNRLYGATINHEGEAI